MGLRCRSLRDFMAHAFIVATASDYNYEVQTWTTKNGDQIEIQFIPGPNQGSLRAISGNVDLGLFNARSSATNVGHILARRYELLVL